MRLTFIIVLLMTAPVQAAGLLDPFYCKLYPSAQKCVLPVVLPSSSPVIVVQPSVKPVEIQAPARADARQKGGKPKPKGKRRHG